ncbi:hypothetical protein CUROG_02200 [Corynebacterium urogenitale]|uniref:Uncharacterized protein n=1 Tax=Corynebacterium urogenitale TaxID=2487892 RepID=A0A5J6Z4I2_9CORY|nr:hypothetical protein CUROG_02200 [Corynebacterium urogenitale]
MLGLSVTPTNTSLSAGTVESKNNLVHHAIEFSNNIRTQSHTQQHRYACLRDGIPSLDHHIASKQTADEILLNNHTNSDDVVVNVRACFPATVSDGVGRADSIKCTHHRSVTQLPSSDHVFTHIVEQHNTHKLNTQHAGA